MDIHVVADPMLRTPRSHPLLYVLIGLPGSGKSTWRNDYLEKRKIVDKPLPVIISTDDLIEETAGDLNMTYSEIWPTVDHSAMLAKELDRFNKAVLDNKDIIIDRTNIKRLTRSLWLDSALGYWKIAVIFNLPIDELKNRVENRGVSSGKIIPMTVIDEMLSEYEPPGQGTEFDDILYVYG